MYDQLYTDETQVQLVLKIFNHDSLTSIFFMAKNDSITSVIDHTSYLNN